MCLLPAGWPLSGLTSVSFSTAGVHPSIRVDQGNSSLFLITIARYCAPFSGMPSKSAGRSATGRHRARGLGEPCSSRFVHGSGVVETRALFLRAAC